MNSVKINNKWIFKDHKIEGASYLIRTTVKSWNPHPKRRPTMPPPEAVFTLYIPTPYDSSFSAAPFACRWEIFNENLGKIPQTYV